MDKRTILFLFCTLAASVSVQYFYQTDQESAPIEKKQVELVSQKEPLPKEAPFSSSRDETFYVLENEYTERDSKIRFSAAPKHRNSSIVKDPHVSLIRSFAQNRFLNHIRYTASKIS